MNSPGERVSIEMVPGFRLEWPITDDLAALREAVRAFGVGAGLTGRQLADVVIVAGEAAAKVWEHRGRGTLIAWSDTGGVSLELVDPAGALTLAYVAIGPHPVPGGGGAVAFSLMRRLCDEVSLDNSDGVLRLHLRFRHRARQNGDRRRPGTPGRRPSLSGGGSAPRSPGS